MLDEQRGGWLPQVCGVVFLLLALEKASWLVRVPPEYSMEFLLGLEVTGRWAWGASAILAILGAWVSAGCFRRHSEMVWAICGYAVYLAASYWVWLAHYSKHSEQTNLISGAFFTGAMLAFCRYLLDRRDQFDQK